MADQPGSGASPLDWYRVSREPASSAPGFRLRWPRRERVLDALACLGLASLCFSQASVEILFRADRDFYNRLPLGTPTILALVVNIVALAAAGFLGLEAIRRVRSPLARRLAAAATAATFLVVLNFVRMTYETIGRPMDALGRSGLVVVVVAILAASFGWPRLALRTMHKIGRAVSPVAVITLVPALWMFLEMAAGPVWRRIDPAPLNVLAPSLRRVVWLVFEELDQGIAFEARPAGLELPELDRLRRESVYADAARPPAGTVDISMPALITGRPVVAVAPVSPNDLELTFADGKTALWSTHPNVFSRARTIGYDTAIVGWHLPYPRVLGSALGAAEWRPSAAFEQTRGETLGVALRNQWESLAPPLHLRRLSLQRCGELGELAIRAATDGRFGLVVLHVPLPLPPGIYDRKTARLTPWNFSGTDAEYLDNLALADRLLGELRHGLDRGRLRDRTWIVVTSDRWWRGAKTPEGDEDRRVPFLVREPEGGRPVHVDNAFNTLGTHDLVLAILRGSITDTDDVVTWLTRYPMAPPREYTTLGRPIY